MADMNSFAFFAVISDANVRTAVRAVLDNYTGTDIFGDRQTETTLLFEAHQVAQGSIDECFTNILELIETGDEEFECPVCKGAGVISGGPHSVHQYPCEPCNGEGYYTLPVPDFAFKINDEPQVEYLGTLRMHVPGLPDFCSDCDGDGAVVVPAVNLIPLIMEATSLEDLRGEVSRLTGQRHLEYFAAAAAAHRIEVAPQIEAAG